MAPVTSAAGVLALLEEPDQDLKIHALHQLDSLVDSLWAEIAEKLATIEELYEDTSFARRELAALVASKVLYHLGEFDDALQYALGAGTLFDISKRSEFVDTMLAKCIDKYILLRAQNGESTSKVTIDARLEAILALVFSRCFEDGAFKQAVGIALETQRLDMLEEAVKRSPSPASVLVYAFSACQTSVPHRGFRHKAYTSIADMFLTLDKPDYLYVCRCFLLRSDANGAFKTLEKLVTEQDERNSLVAFQIAFDMVESNDIHFLKEIAALVQSARAALSAEGPAASATSTKLETLHGILSREMPVTLQLEFLYRNCKSDPLLMNTVRDSVEQRSSIAHAAAVVCNSFLHAGTGHDEFLRENLSWLARANNWAKFSATASLGVVQRGLSARAQTVLGPYLPQGEAPSSPYSEGGALYALGLAHAGNTSISLQYLANSLQNAASNEIVLHGACLGVGLSGIASHDESLYDSLKNVLFNDNAVAGEAASIAMGLVMLGAPDSNMMEEMIAYAQDTQHEKIIRGLGLALALMMNGREEEADPLIERLAHSKDAVLRYSAMQVIASAYAGTSNNGAVRKLLHFAVSDVSDNVRRAAVISIGFVLASRPDQVPRVVSLLAGSYNPHVRYGAALALGFACSGTGSSEAIALLEPLMKDHVDFVRQGTMIAMSMVLCQISEGHVSKVKELREKLLSSIADRHEAIMAKMGALWAIGILDAGGRNAVPRLMTRTGQASVLGVVGSLVFTQYWYWHPLVHFLSLSFTPSTLIALDKSLKMPEMELRSNAKPSLFSYPEPMKPKETRKRERIATAVLSTTAKVKARKGDKAANIEGKAEDDASTGTRASTDAKGTEADGATSKKPDDSTVPMEDDTGADASKAAEGKEEGADGEAMPSAKVSAEPKFETLKNPCRVTLHQERFVSFEHSTFAPVVSGKRSGIVVVSSKKASEEGSSYIQYQTGNEEGASGEDTAPAASAAADDEEPAPPEPFEFTA